ncbi:MAG TPA: XTP/dITP diphosphatase [Candidatus Thermoplasmatota archaeon]
MPSGRPRHRRLVIVTTNPGKVREFRAALRGLPVDLHTVRRPYHEIQADTLEEVASFGVQELAGDLRGDFFVEDSGLFIDSVRGFPGVYSAYVMKTVGVEGTLRLLRGSDDRRATFASVIGLSFAGETRLFRGECHGTIARAARGHGGFGFDPIFVARGAKRTFAEMPVEEKLRYSHRGKAAALLHTFLERRLAGARLRR